MEGRGRRGPRLADLAVLARGVGAHLISITIMIMNITIIITIISIAISISITSIIVIAIVTGGMVLLTEILLPRIARQGTFV